ncbi:MAG: hypothetical protein ABEH59_12915 [Halobacteriales archaeon]
MSQFDAPTGFAAGVNSVTATLNNRKEFLVNLGVLNKIGLKQDGLTVTRSGDLLVGDLRLENINATLQRKGLGELSLIPTTTFRRKLGTTYPQLSETRLNLINPAPIPSLLSDKAKQYWELFDTPVTVPPWQPLDHYTDSNIQSDADSLERDFIQDAPLVLKARNATQGQGIWFYPDGVTAFIEDWVSETAPGAFLNHPNRFLLQYAIPHIYDKRVLTAGPTPVAGEDRYGSPHTDKSNLNLVDLDATTLRDAAIELLERGAVRPLQLDRIDPAVERAVTDLFEAMAPLTVESQDELHTWIGWDFLVVDPDDERLSAVPDDVIGGLLNDRYRTEEGCYLAFGEGNLSPGSKERFVNAMAHGREGLKWDSAANLLGYGTSISKGESFEPGIPDFIDPDLLARRYSL